MANEGSPANPSLSGAQILAKLLALGALGAAFSDDVFAIKGSADATKLARFEVDGLTTATTRVYTLPDASITVAGINLAQTWTVAQTFSATISVDIGTGVRPSAASPLSNSVLTVFATDGQFPRIWGESYGNTGLVLTGRAISGTRALPTATAGGLALLALTATGYDGTSYLTAGRGQYGIFAASLWTLTNNETFHEWRATPSGSTTNTTYMRLMGGGRLLIGTTLPTDDTVSALQVVGAATFSSTLAVTSNAGIGGAVSSLSVLQLGATNPLSGVIQIGGFVNMTGTSAGTTALRGAQFSLSTAAASYTCAEATAFLCGAIAKGASSTITRATSAWIDPQSNGTNNCGLLIATGVTYTGSWAIRSESTNASTLAGALSVTDATDSASTSTGCLILSGGAGITKSVVIGGTLSVGNAIAMTSASNAASFTISDAGTASTPTAFACYHNTSGTPAGGFGSAFVMGGQTTTSTGVSQAYFQAYWVVATHASRTARVILSAFDAAGVREGLRIEASGSAPMLGLYGTAAVIQYATTGTSTGFTAGGGTTATSTSTFTGNTGSTAYTVGDVVRALKLIGLIAA